MNNYHILRASLSVCPARSAERTFQASLYTAPFPALSFGGADLTYSLFSPEQIRIPSTHPLRGATSSAYRQYRQYGISIHAPLAGCDSKNRQISRIASVVFAIKQQILQQEPCNCKKRPGKSGSKAQFPRANRPGKSCTHPVRAKGSGHPPHHIRASHQSAQLWHGSPGCKTAGCPVPAP